MKTLLAAGLAAGALLLSASSASGKTFLVSHPRGLVPPVGFSTYAQAGSPLALPQASTSATSWFSYHGGPVMASIKTYAIYWMPSGSTCSGVSCTGYESTINRYFADVAHDSGLSTNVYAVDTQYSGIAYSSAFGGAIVDINAYPASACNDGSGIDTSCLDEAQLETEISNQITAHSWPTGTTDMFFIFLPDNIGTCFLPGSASGTNQACSTTAFCAYHDAFGTVNSPTIFAVEPENATAHFNLGGSCSSGESPAGNGADDTINTISHEHNEAITDPESSLGAGAWYWDDTSNLNDANNGFEIGDLCAWTFGSLLGANYNQVINGHDYYLQEEWSNAGSSCLLNYPPPKPTNINVPTLTGTAAVGRSLVSTAGTWTNSPTSIHYQWQRCDATGATNCTAVGTNSNTYVLGSADVGYTIRSEVTATNAGGTSDPVDSSLTSVVVGTPTTAGAPGVTGVTAVGHTLTTDTGSWNGAPTSYSYKWEQCDASGANCTLIAGATTATYQLAAGDAGHTIRSEVSATNAAGSSAYVESAQTETVVPLPAANTLPAVSGVAAVGQTLSTTTGTWNTPSTYAYEWLRCSATGTSCSAISNADSADYLVKPEDAGHALEARVSATNAAGTVTSTSAATAVVIDVPGVTKAPKLSGKAKVGRKLSVSTGTWTGSPTGYSFQWLRCSKKGTACKRIPGAHAASYKVTKKDVRHKLEAKVTATNAAGKFTAHSGKSGLAHK